MEEEYKKLTVSASTVEDAMEVEESPSEGPASALDWSNFLSKEEEQ